MLTSTLLFVLLFQLFLAVRAAPLPFDFDGLLDDVFGGDDDDTSNGNTLGGALDGVVGDSDEGGNNDSGPSAILDDLLGSGDDTTESNGGSLNDGLDTFFGSNDTYSTSTQSSDDTSSNEDSGSFLDGLLGKAEDAISDGASDLLGDLLGDDDSASSNATSSTVSVTSATLTATFSRPAFFSRIAYCSSASVTNFSCGAPCDALDAQSVEILATGGDGGTVPRSHQGTDPDNILSILNDVEFFLTPIDTDFFPSAAGSFLETFSRIASTVLSTVQSALTSTGAQSVVVTGHSLGAALATLDALMFHDALTNISIQTTTFGSPRVGDQAFADFVDSSLSNEGFARITNKADPVPHLPPLVLDFVHAQGEVHLGDAGAVLCEGQENKSDDCADGVGALAIVDGVDDHIESVRGSMVPSVEFVLYSSTIRACSLRIMSAQTRYVDVHFTQEKRRAYGMHRRSGLPDKENWTVYREHLYYSANARRLWFRSIKPFKYLDVLVPYVLAAMYTDVYGKWQTFRRAEMMGNAEKQTKETSNQRLLIPKGNIHCAFHTSDIPRPIAGCDNEHITIQLKFILLIRLYHILPASYYSFINPRKSSRTSLRKVKQKYVRGYAYFSVSSAPATGEAVTIIAIVVEATTQGPLGR
ncbi:Alpha/Beta hydrolase protein [Armillaria luteobubalina]|uniref:Alpha/Beta hydrolase protein n=1 Tax=Armillaria luteobubalina TaxID=153913 RepID=A0AA39QFA4_9AGAR|nr:Alpha/Beta hydrolase protein [Armillaria luteobubalina]